VIIVHRTGALAAARIADRGLDAADLFVTACDLSAPAATAHWCWLRPRRAARGANAATIVPWRPWQRTGLSLGLLAVLAAAIAFVPQLDPFGRQSALQQSAKRKTALELERKEAQRQIEELKARQPDAKVSAEVAEELKKLQATLDAMKPEAQDANRKALDVAKAELARKLEQSAPSVSRTASTRASARRSSAAPATARRPRPSRSSSRGRDRRGEKAIDEPDPRRSAATGQGSGPEAKIAEKMHRQLKALEEAAKSQPAGFSQAVRQSLDQLANSGNADQSDQALQALRDSLDLAKLEMQSGAQGERDLQAMQEALQAMHLAQKLNDQNGLDGKDSQGLKTMEDYKKLYAEALAKLGKGGGGGGTGSNEGQGDGSTRPIDDSVTTGFNPSRTPSPLTAGKTLMQWKTHGASEPGKVAADYLPAVREVAAGRVGGAGARAGAARYHDGVKKYFDGLEPGK